MYVPQYIMACSHNHCCHGNATICSLFIVVGIYVAVNNISVQCCHKNATMGSIYIVVELQNIS